LGEFKNITDLWSLLASGCYGSEGKFLYECVETVITERGIKKALQDLGGEFSQ